MSHVAASSMSKTPPSVPRRKSSRLRTKSASSSPSMSLTHRTISGGVTQSSKLASRITTERVHSTTQKHATDTSQAKEIDMAEPETDEDTDQPVTTLPDGQSDDEEQIVRSRTIREKVLEYFDDDPRGLKCKICENVFQTGTGSDANLRSHLGRVHNMRHFFFPSQLPAQKKLRSASAPISAERRRELNDLVVKCIIRDGRAFDDFNKAGMSRFIEAALPGYSPPHRKTIRRHIASNYAQYRAELREILSKVGLIALTTDIWKSGSRTHFICLTGHFYDDDFQQVSLVLGFRRLVGRHLSVTLNKYIKYELAQLKIKDYQIVSITTDNGSDIKAATSTSDFGERISCFAHNLNLVITNGLNLWKKPDPKNFPLDDNNLLIDEPDEESVSGDDVPQGLLSDEEEENETESNGRDEEESVFTEANKISRIAVEDEFDSDEDNNAPAMSIQNRILPVIDDQDLYVVLEQVFEILGRTRATVKFVCNHSVVLALVRNESGRSTGKGGLVLDMKIRWGSTYQMIARFLQHQDIVNRLIASKRLDGLTTVQQEKFKGFAFSHDDWDLLIALNIVLEPFQIATQLLSASHYPTMALSQYAFQMLESFLKQKTEDSSLVASLKKSVRFYFNKYFISKLPAAQKKMMLIAAFLDPFIYQSLSDENRKKAKKLIAPLMNATIVLPNTHTVSSTAPTQTATSSSTFKKLSLFDQLAQLCGKPVSEGGTTTKKSLSIDEELSHYIRATSSGLKFQQFWSEHQKSFPRLARLARRFCLVPATSVPCEASFSVAGFINRKQRQSLASSTLRQLMVLKDSYKIDTLKLDDEI